MPYLKLFFFRVPLPACIFSWLESPCWGTEIKLTFFYFSLSVLFKLEILPHNRTHNYTSSIYITPQPFTPGSGKQAFRNIVGGQILTILVGLGLLIVEASS